MAQTQASTQHDRKFLEVGAAWTKQGKRGAFLSIQLNTDLPSIRDLVEESNGSLLIFKSGSRTAGQGNIPTHKVIASADWTDEQQRQFYESLREEKAIRKQIQDGDQGDDVQDES